MVNGIIIPADNTAPLRIGALDSLEDYMRAVGGWIEAVDIPDLGVTMYVNEEGLIRDLPFNRRVTFLWRFHVPRVRDARLVGDVAVVGLTADEGENTEVPIELRQRLLEPGVYRVRTVSAPRAGGTRNRSIVTTTSRRSSGRRSYRRCHPLWRCGSSASKVSKARAISLDGGRWS